MADPADLMEVADCLCLAARRASRSLSRSYEQQLRPHGIRIGQFSVLTVLILRGPMTIGSLADFLGVERTTLTRNLALIESKRWVAIHPGKDARSRVVEVTPAGRAKVATAAPAWRAAQEAARKAIGPAGVASLRRLAERTTG
ncbi:MAG TPA: MarR family transcriptional regulator [Bauldia sp.]|nr:MarR family transcriptional regulator [Bauldia sp.]